MSAEANLSHELVVPMNYPTLQAAVDAAQPGDRIHVRPGVYREQVVIDKNVSMTGSGARKTTILAPRTLVAGEDGGTSIVEIHNGASAALSQLAVSGPGSGTCGDGALGSGVRVLGGARLDLGHARVTHITHITHTPPAPCPHSAVAVFVGDLPTGTGSVSIHDTEISDYQGSGVTVLNEGSSATIVDSAVTGHPRRPTDGIGFVSGAVGRVPRSTVSGNDCREPDPDCGPDFFSETQHAGIVASTPGTVVRDDRLAGNGPFTVRNDRIEGGVGGVAVVAASADTQAVLDGVRVKRTSGAPVRTFECCGFTATATVRQ
ncbi:hypothetical protein [Streptomyces sp. NPDC058086]|uniref:hypothetical protein n=1 Tax=Streptomyces sp. NPDC058086 TaxID=3346334 RepID=UPI0036E98CB7